MDPTSLNDMSFCKLLQITDYSMRWLLFIFVKKKVKTLFQHLSFSPFKNIRVSLSEKKLEFIFFLLIKKQTVNLIIDWLYCLLKNIC